MYSSGNNFISGNNVGVGQPPPSRLRFLVRPNSYTNETIVGNRMDPFKIEFYQLPPQGNFFPLPGFYTALFVKWNGNIGFHTDEPEEKFHVNASGRFDGNLKIGNNNWTSLTFDGSGNNDWMFNAHNDENSFHIRANSGTSTGFIKYWLSINRNSGNVGINKTSPSERLHVDGNLLVDNGALHIEDGNRWQLKASQNGLSIVNHLFLRDDFWINWSNGNVGIGTTTPNAKLHVDGKVQIGLETITGGVHNTSQVKLTVDGHAIFRKVIVTQSKWSDFVFAEYYELTPLKEVETFIKENKHLPNIPNENDVLENGINLGDMDALLLQKIEELTLYMIELQKKNQELEAIVNSLKN